MFSLARSLRSPRGIRPRSAGSWPRRNRRITDRIIRFGAPLVAIGGIVGIAAAVWILAGGDPSSVLPLPARPAAAIVDPAGGVPVHLDSVPSGADGLVDGVRRGQTPLVASLVPGQHTYTLRHPDALEVTQTFDVPDTGASAVVRLWRYRPSVLPLGSVYPGAILADARFLADGRVALIISLPIGAAGLNERTPMHEVWLLDPSTGRLSHAALAGVDVRPTVVALAPDGKQVAYVTAGASQSTSLWPGNGTGPLPSRQDGRSDTVWIAPLDGRSAPRPVLKSDTPVTQGFGRDPEHIVDLVWTPDGTRLVAVSRQGGTPTRTRLFLVQVGPDDESGAEVQATQLVVLPAEVAPGAAVPDPSGQWLALMAHAAAAAGGRDVVMLCTVELRPGGTFRELADLGSAQRAPTTAAIAWAPAGRTQSAGRLAFVAPAPADASSGGGLFDLFSAFRASSPPSGLFVADLQATGLEVSQPRRLGTMTNVVAPVWRSDNELFGFIRQDGALGLRLMDPATATVRDAGIRLQPGVGQGSGLAAHWDAENGRVLLLSRRSSSAIVSGSGPLEAWLVSFATTPPPDTGAR